MFVRDLAEHAAQREYVYAHRWRQFDLVMRDNRAGMHRTTVADRAPTLEQPL